MSHCRPWTNYQGVPQTLDDGTAPCSKTLSLRMWDSRVHGDDVICANLSAKSVFFPLFPSASCLCATKRSFFRDRVCYSIALLYYSVSNRRIIASVMSRCLIKGACIKLTYSSCAASSASVPSDLKALYKSVIIIIIIIICLLSNCLLSNCKGCLIRPSEVKLHITLQRVARALVKLQFLANRLLTD